MLMKRMLIVLLILPLFLYILGVGLNIYSPYFGGIEPESYGAKRTLSMASILVPMNITGVSAYGEYRMSKDDFEQMQKELNSMEWEKEWRSYPFFQFPGAENIQDGSVFGHIDIRGVRMVWLVFDEEKQKLQIGCFKH